MSILIGGGTGFIGRNLVKQLAKSNYKVIIITRNPKQENEIDWSTIQSSGIPQGVRAVVNLAGCPLKHRLFVWFECVYENDSNRVCNSFYPFPTYSKFAADECEHFRLELHPHTFHDSRVGTNQILARAIREMSNPPEVFVTMSMTAFYEESETKHDLRTESSPNGTTDMSRMVNVWEMASVLPSNVPVRRVVIRSGHVLGADGGILNEGQNMLRKMAWFLGIIMFRGFPMFVTWIHITDLVRLIQFAIENNSMKGVFNGDSPMWCSLEDFKGFVRACFRGSEVKYMVFLRYATSYIGFRKGGEFFRIKRSIHGQIAIPERLQRLGFTYEFHHLVKALKDIFKSKMKHK